MNRPGSVGLVVLAVVVAVAGIGGPLAVVGVTASVQEPTSATASLSSGASSSTGVAPAALQSDGINSATFDRTTFVVTVYENGSATWTHRHEMDLNESSDDREAFEAIIEDFESNDSGVTDLFESQARALAAKGSNTTGREMAARDFTATAYIDQETNLDPSREPEIGVVEQSFTWEGFADVDGGSVTAGDVFDGLIIDSDQSIVFRPGGDLVFESVAPDDAQYTSPELADADEVVWNGDREFLAGHPRVVYDDPDITGPDSDDPVSTVTGAASDLLWPLVVLAILAGIGGAVVWYRRSDRSDDEATAATTESLESAPPPDAAGDRSTAEAGDLDDADDGGLPEEELLTDEDRVVTLIRENGGRMKQVNIVEETGWSKSKVSMLLSDMEEEGTISKLRVGRENIISLQGFEPEATKSPFEE
ncbi:helix-turn-helix transcriptional regulator [Halosolutus amylolyticus]|uniref:Helix-turn-helix transcriptional regulator n=1 Tax=Halosolutus amylolyticus TaxID=2932267 RepID=A0ABD5PLR0_9EURY|nr:hypothetical protein [Halosolutus amylolyticus]